MTIILSIGMAAMLLGCGLFNDGGQPVQNEGAASVPPPLPQPIASSRPGYDGPSSLEERIFASDVIARVELQSVSSRVESGTADDGTPEYIPILEFSFSVLEYLRGSGASDIVAVWAGATVFNTQQEAEAALPAIVAARDTQWDSREAVLFLQHSIEYLPSTQQAGRYYLAWGDASWGFDDAYSIASRHDRLWLPAEVAAGASSPSSGDEQRFLLEAPPDTGSAATITLGEMKERIAAVVAKLDAGDGSEEYTECVWRTYRYEGINRYRLATRGRSYHVEYPDHELDSGLGASTVVYEETDLGGLLNQRDELWLDGGDAELFSIDSGDAIPYDWSGDGVTDSIQYDQGVVTVRPLPQGAYRFHFNQRDAYFVPCDGYVHRYEWTVTVTASEGMVHELFFDPVTVGSTVAADSTNGVLKPTTFTDTNGSPATLQSISYQSGTVEVEVSPDDALMYHALDFIDLDGTVSLTLEVAEATVDAANDTLSWSVTSPPWEDGDLLMVRIYEIPLQ